MDFNNLKVTVNQDDDQSIEAIAIGSYARDQVEVFIRTFNQMPSGIVFKNPDYGLFKVTTNWVDPVTNSIGVFVEPI